ncbi:guanylate-binding protein [Gregarina niphandrodes]|uniref:Guanylate-binding protein n=1 Tax=Gregarina niphandrodes TaxID=110365 RepID=A0A023B300_GRENI|nr:guanylate-binding protein [Gregarina niphandrodes]EZG53975.1 guanylate-binding protein [Gregarina niphandrodes]|eukprot:XP_011131851.1 guanylate-binding protein [Gregarina niphandrodes]
MRGSIILVGACLAAASLTDGSGADGSGADGSGGGPIQLVRPKAGHADLEATEEGLNYLRSLVAPIAVVSAVGAIHTGKSFLLNQLSDVGQGFSVGYTVRPETSGIWLMPYPRLLDGAGNVAASSSGASPGSTSVSDMSRTPGAGTTLLFLDTEGLFSKDASSSYDAKLFAISTLLSSEVIYNTVKFIDTHHMEALETLIRRTNLFGLRAYARQKVSAVANLSEFLRVLVPSQLSWVVQDFVQDLENLEPEAWLEELLTRGGVATGTPSEVPEERVGNFFKRIDCVTLPVPASSNDLLQKLDTIPSDQLDAQYRIGIANFRNRLMKRAVREPKFKGGGFNGHQGTLGSQDKLPMTGGDMADLLIFLIEAANTSSTDGNHESPFPELPSVAEQFTKLQLKLMQTDILAILEKDLNEVSNRHIRESKPLGAKAFEYEIEKQTYQALKLWK